MGPNSNKRILPRLTDEEEESLRLQKLQERADENARAIRSSVASLQTSINVSFNHMGNTDLQMPDSMTEVTTMMQQHLGLTAPTALTFGWNGFPDQEPGDQSSFTTPPMNFDSPGEENIVDMQRSTSTIDIFFQRCRTTRNSPCRR
jgi:hypothetical protein